MVVVVCAYGVVLPLSLKVSWLVTFEFAWWVVYFKFALHEVFPNRELIDRVSNFCMDRVLSRELSFSCFRLSSFEFA